MASIFTNRNEVDESGFPKQNVSLFYCNITNLIMNDGNGSYLMSNLLYPNEMNTGINNTLSHTTTQLVLEGISITEQQWNSNESYPMSYPLNQNKMNTDINNILNQTTTQLALETNLIEI